LKKLAIAKAKCIYEKIKCTKTKLRRLYQRRGTLCNVIYTLRTRQLVSQHCFAQALCGALSSAHFQDALVMEGILAACTLYGVVLQMPVLLSMAELEPQEAASHTV
jgi:hypothetical protein